MTSVRKLSPNRHCSWEKEKYKKSWLPACQYLDVNEGHHENRIDQYECDSSNHVYNYQLADWSGEEIKLPIKDYIFKINECSKLCLQGYPCTFRNLDNGGLLSGTGGLGYMLLQMVRSPLLDKDKENLLKQALYLADEMVEFCKKSSVHGELVSFFKGKGGLFALAAAIYRTCGQESKASDCLARYLQGKLFCQEVSYSLTGSDELCYGRAGYILGIIWLNGFFYKDELDIAALGSILDTIIIAGRELALKVQISDRSPLMYSYLNCQHLGILHGLSGILLVFLLCPFYLNKNKNAERYVRTAVDYILSLQCEDGSFPNKIEDIDPDKKYEEVAQWSSGAAGVIFLLAKAYLRWNDEKYLNGCVKCSDFVWAHGLTKKGLGLGWGLSGNTYVHLLMYRLTKDNLYLGRAQQFADFMMSEKSMRHIYDKDNVRPSQYSLFDGLAGAVVLLIDLLNVSEAVFPFMPIFSNVDSITDLFF